MMGRDNKVANRSQTISFIAAGGFHLLIVLMLILTFNHTVIIPAHSPNEAQPEIIDAVVVNQKALQNEVARLEAVEAKKREKEQAREQALVRKEQEAKEKRIKEEQLAMELKKQNEQLKKEALEQKAAQEQAENERKEKLKAQEEELKKIEKKKVQALAAKEKAEKDKKAAELAKQKAAEAAKQNEGADNAPQQAGAKVTEDETNRHVAVIKRKVQENWRQPMGFEIKGLKCKLAIKLTPTGEVLSVKVIQSSGNLEYDRSAELAVRKASPLPMPEKAALAKEFREFDFGFTPEGV